MQSVPIEIKRGIITIALAVIVYAAYVLITNISPQVVGSLSLKIWGIYFAIHIFIVFLLYSIWLRKNWAKWFLLIWFLINCCLFLLRLASDTELSTDDLIEMVTTILEIIGLQQLLSKKASLWFSK